MIVDTDILIPMTDVNQNFSRVTEQGAAVILKNNNPKYVVVDFSEYDEFQKHRNNIIEKTADGIIEQNLEAFKELAK